MERISADEMAAQAGYYSRQGLGEEEAVRRAVRDSLAAIGHPAGG